MDFRSYHSLVVSPPTELQFNAQTFGSKQMTFIRVYQEKFHSFAPVVCCSLLREGLNPVMFESLGLECPSTEIAKQHAAKSATWAAAALGACLQSNCASMDMYDQAIEHLSQCYDYPCEEVIRAYCALALAACQLGDEKRFTRFKESAKLLFGELSEVSDECKVCLQFCYVAVHPQHDIELQFDVDWAQRLPFNLQVLYLITVANYKIDVFMMTPAKSPELRQSECEKALAFLRPMAARLAESHHTYSNLIGRFHCYSLTSYFAVNIGEMDESMKCVDAIVDLICRYPWLLTNQIIWHVTKTVISFLRALGHEEERRIAVLENYLVQHPCYSPLGNNVTFDSETIVEDFKSTLKVKRTTLEELSADQSADGYFQQDLLQYLQCTGDDEAEEVLRPSELLQLMEFAELELS